MHLRQNGQAKKEEYVKEKILERRLVLAVKKVGGVCPKFVSPGLDGMPDRLILLPGGRIAFAEVKRHGEKPRPPAGHPAWNAPPPGLCSLYAGRRSTD